MPLFDVTFTFTGSVAVEAPCADSAREIVQGVGWDELASSVELLCVENVEQRGEG